LRSTTGIGKIENKDHFSPAKAGHWAELGSNESKSARTLEGYLCDDSTQHTLYEQNPERKICNKKREG